MSESERQLLKSAKNGNIEAFEKLTESYHKKIYNIILKNRGCEYDISGPAQKGVSNPAREDASRLAQEVFVRMYKSLKYQRDDSMFVITLYKTARDVCRGC